MALSLDQYRLLGNSGLRVSPIAFGTQTFGLEWGHGCSKEDSRRLFDCYVELGGNFFDTSNVYNNGTAEAFLGEFISGKRDKFVISTKYTMHDGTKDPNAGGNHRKNMFRSLDDSLKRLKTEYVDIFWVHAWDFRTPVEEILRALNVLISQGKVLHIGICNAPAWKISEANTIASLRGISEFIGIQVQYNLLERNAERDIIPLVREKGIAFLPWSPLAGGLLTGAFTRADLTGSGAGSYRGVEKQSAEKLPLLNEKNIEKIEAVSRFAEQIHKLPSQVALNWVLNKPGVTCPILGANSVEQMNESFKALEFSLSDEQMAYLDKITGIDLGSAHYFTDPKAYRSAIDGGLQIERKYYEHANYRLQTSPRPSLKKEMTGYGSAFYKLKSGIKKVIKAANPVFHDKIIDSMYLKRLNRPGSDLKWVPLPRSPQTRLDAAGAQIGNKLYIFGGYNTSEKMSETIDVFDLERCSWSGQWRLPSDVPQSHQGVAVEAGRYVYLISGQLGPSCYPAVADSFVFDAQAKSWARLPSLPQARYAPAVGLWNGRLHVVSGAMPDRFTPAADHWSIAVKDGKALENSWREEKPIPRGGMHRPSAVLDGRFYVFGGQQGDWVAKPGDPKFAGIAPPVPEICLNETYMLPEPSGDWQRKSDMPFPASQTEFAIVSLGNSSIAILGGMTGNNPNTKMTEMISTVQVYDAAVDKWEVAGTLPYRVKSTVAAYYNGQIFFATGQRDRGADNPSPGAYEDHVWKAPFHSHA